MLASHGSFAGSHEGLQELAQLAVDVGEEVGEEGEIGEVVEGGVPVFLARDRPSKVVSVIVQHLGDCHLHTRARKLQTIHISRLRKENGLNGLNSGLHLHFQHHSLLRNFTTHLNNTTHYSIVQEDVIQASFSHLLGSHIDTNGPREVASLCSLE